MSNERQRVRVKKMIVALRKLFPRAKIVLHYGNPWELYVAVVLSAQCTDKKVNEVTATLFKKYRTLDDYVHADRLAFERAVHATGFFRNKTKSILGAAKMVKEEFGGNLPRTMEELLTIPGVGRKTANVLLGNLYGITEGIAVDTHVLRLSKQLGLTRFTDPAKIEKDLMVIVPRKDWMNFTYLLIDYGRKYCPARRHDHVKCPLSKFYL